MRKPSDSIKLVWPPLLLVVCFWGTSIYGLNFGAHWDENRAKFDAISNTLKTGLFLQASDFADEGGHYNHGGLNYLLTWSGLTPEVVRFIIAGPRTRDELSRIISPILYSNTVRMRVRAIYVVLSSLSLIWLYCLNQLQGRSRFESFLAAAILSSSWEIAYHSRWVAPDVVMMQFALLAFLFLALGIKDQRAQWFYFGAIVVGLTIGTKYTGGIILPFFLTGVGWTIWREHRSWSVVLKKCAALLATTVLTFLVTTPGAVIDPFRFLIGVLDQQQTYAAGWYGYTVEPGLRHLFEILRYFTIQVFSHYWSISFVVASFSAIGIMALLLERRLVTTLLISCSIIYVLFFSQQSAMIVRNLLVVVPCLALGAARAIVLFGERVGRWKTLVYVAVGAFLGVNFAWQIYAARQVKIRFHPEYYATAFVESVRRSPNETVFISSQLSQMLRDLGVAIPGNVVTDPSAAHIKVAFLQSESADVLWQTWPSNRWGMYEKVFGPLEVNLEAYTTFIGNQRILLVNRETLLTLPLKETDLVSP